jgi:hypothetical protein
MSAPDTFSQTYREARERFIGAAEALHLDVQSHTHPMLGRDGETLAMDVVRDGPESAASVLIVSSACHGVEGFCGSAIQSALLQDAEWRRAAHDTGVAVLYVHALNPYGFSWWRRTTHENVDLNRNFHDFSGPLPANPGYEEIASLLVPATWPPTADVEAALQRYADTHGMAAMQRAVSGGQYTHPEGIFYGGRNPTWSHATLRHVLQDHGRRCKQLAWIDLHTGLGPTGVGERIHSGRDDPVELQRARAWWGEQVTSIYAGTSSSARLDGLMWHAAYEECPQAVYTGIALEFGTLPLEQMFGALRGDQWLELHPEADPALQQAIKRQVRDAFYVDTDEWKRQVIEQGLDAARAAVAGLSQAG